MGELKKSASVERTTVSLDSEIFGKAKRKAEIKGLKFSNYLASLITKDVANESFVADNPMSSTIVVDLARVLVGELDAKEVAKRLGDQDQPKVLQAWLRSIIEADAEDDEGAQIAKTIREMHAKQEPIARRILREKAERRAKREGGA